MAGIRSLGVHIPAGRLARSLLAGAWGTSGLPGERSVAGGDEDVVTMGVEAASSAVGSDGERSGIGAVFFATTTSPYSEKLGAALIAGALDLDRSAVTVDVTDSLRCGVDALQLAVQAVGGGVRRALVVVADTRQPAPGTQAEQVEGDGAVALVVDAEGGVADIEGVASCHEDSSLRWQRRNEPVVREFEARVELSEGYGRVVPETSAQALGRAGVQPDELAALAIVGPGKHYGLAAVRRMGLPPERLVDGGLDQIGFVGYAAPFLGLVNALHTVSTGAPVLLAVSGDGCGAMVLRRGPAPVPDLVAEAVKKRGPRLSYEEWLATRGLLNGVEEHDWEISPTAYWRAQDHLVRRRAGRCSGCGTVQFPRSATCTECSERGTQAWVRLTERGRVFTFSNEHLLGGRYLTRPFSRCVVDLDGGGRLCTLMTDCDPDDVEVGMAVQLTFRAREYARSFRNYGWKCRPVEVGT